MGTRARGLSGKQLSGMGVQASGRPAGGLLAPEVDVTGASRDPKGTRGGCYGRLMRPKMADFVNLMSLCSGITTSAAPEGSREVSGEPLASQQASKGVHSGPQMWHQRSLWSHVGAPGAPMAPCEAPGRTREASEGSRGVKWIPKGLKWSRHEEPKAP